MAGSNAVSSFQDRLRSACLYSTSTVMGAFIAGWMHTLDSRICFHDRSFDPASIGYRGPAIFVVWHEYLLLLFNARRDCGVVMLASQHRDADWLVALGGHFGFKPVRGSTNRGGAQAMLKIVRQLQGHDLVITPDGPRGPRRQVSNGCVYLSSLLEVPIIPIGCGYHRPWRYRRAWDQFAVPGIGSRVRAIVGAPIHVPKRISKEQVEEFRKQVELELTTITTEAEGWADQGESKDQELPLYPTTRNTLKP